MVSEMALKKKFYPFALNGLTIFTTGIPTSVRFPDSQKKEVTEERPKKGYVGWRVCCYSGNPLILKICKQQRINMARRMPKLEKCGARPLDLNLDKVANKSKKVQSGDVFKTKLKHFEHHHL